MKTTYRTRMWPERVLGESGYGYEVRDHERRVIAHGWSRGKKIDAEQEARAAIASHQARKAAAA